MVITRSFEDYIPQTASHRDEGALPHLTAKVRPSTKINLTGAVTKSKSLGTVIQKASPAG